MSRKHCKRSSCGCPGPQGLPGTSGTPGIPGVPGTPGTPAPGALGGAIQGYSSGPSMGLVAETSGTLTTVGLIASGNSNTADETVTSGSFGLNASLATTPIYIPYTASRPLQLTTFTADVILSSTTGVSGLNGPVTMHAAIYLNTSGDTFVRQPISDITLSPTFTSASTVGTKLSGALSIAPGAFTIPSGSRYVVGFYAIAAASNDNDVAVNVWADAGLGFL